MITYQNGNISVSISPNGTKIREYEGIPTPISPETIDIKITDQCDMGCAWCHERSTTQGKHANLDMLLHILSDLPAGIELAIGGGNPLSHPDLVEFLMRVKKNDWIANLTINQAHIETKLLSSLIKEELIKGVGISITNANNIPIGISPHMVYHIIAGVHNVEIMDKLTAREGSKILILGYKIFGRGSSYYDKNQSVVIEGLNQWYQNIPKYFGKSIISFDNLALEQLNIRRFFDDTAWQTFYMGDDGTFSMYIDAVKQEYAKTSRSTERVSFQNMSLLRYFKAC